MQNIPVTLSYLYVNLFYRIFSVCVVKFLKNYR